MAFGMHFINCKTRILEIKRLARQTVWSKLASEIIYNCLWGLFKVCEERRKDVIATFSMGHFVEAKAN
jgi:hypothetical protein